MAFLIVQDWRFQIRDDKDSSWHLFSRTDNPGSWFKSHWVQTEKNGKKHYVLAYILHTHAVSSSVSYTCFEHPFIMKLKQTVEIGSPVNWHSIFKILWLNPLLVLGSSIWLTDIEIKHCQFHTNTVRLTDTICLCMDIFALIGEFVTVYFLIGHLVHQSIRILHWCLCKNIILHLYIIGFYVVSVPRIRQSQCLGSCVKTKVF